MPKPKWKVEEAIRAGAGMYELACTYRKDLEPRVEAGAIDGLGEDVRALRDATSGAVQARAERSAATAGQDEAIRNGEVLVGMVRAAVRRRFPDQKSVQKAFGVGSKLRSNNVGSIAAALTTIIEAAGKNPEPLRLAGVLPADLDDARALLAALVGADVDQEGKKTKATGATATRAATQVRLEAGFDMILAAAMLAFRNHPEVLARFTALIPSTGRKATARTPEPVA